MAKLTVADVPHMFRLWDHELNTEVPADVSARCREQKFWRCPDCGYAWSASPRTRYKGSGQCPCHEANKVIKRGVNDALTLVRGLEALLDDDNDFDAICNQGLNSSMSVNFKCDECGRKWTASLLSQVKKDGNGGYFAAGCPHYNTVKRKKSDVPLCTEVDAIIKFWDDNNPMDPAKTRSNSTESAHFICKNCGYDWTTTIVGQEKGTGKCNCCELQRVTRKGTTDVFTLIPDSRRFYDYNKNDGIDIYSISLRNSEIQIDWKCPDCGREWQSSLAARVKGKKGSYSFAGCQECYIRSLEAKITPVASMPKLMKSWDFRKNKASGLDPNLTSVHANIPAAWKCKECGYEWTATIKGQTGIGGACPFCSGFRGAVMKDVNDVLTLCPDLATIYDFEYNEKNGLDIYKEGAGSKATARFTCRKCGNEWDSPINGRVKKTEDGLYKLVDCPACSNGAFRKIPYSVEFPLLAKMYREDLNHIPLDAIRGLEAISYTHYQWDCPTCGETFASTLNAMKSSHKSATHGCPYCSHTRPRKGESFSELHPEMMDDYDPQNAIDPSNVLPYSGSSVKWICKDCGHHWEATFALRHAGGGRCPLCNRTFVIPEKNSFAAIYPEHVKYWAGSNEKKPDEVFYNSSQWFRWRCPDCNGDYNAPIKEMVEGYTCPYCNNRQLLLGYNSFADKHPDLLEELDATANYLLPKSPYEVMDTSDYKFWFTCKNNAKHKYPMSPRTRLLFQKRNREPCLYCRGQRRKLNRFVSFGK